MYMCTVCPQEFNSKLCITVDVKSNALQYIYTHRQDVVNHYNELLKLCKPRYLHGEVLIVENFLHRRRGVGWGCESCWGDNNALGPRGSHWKRRRWNLFLFSQTFLRDIGRKWGYHETGAMKEKKKSFSSRPTPVFLVSNSHLAAGKQPDQRMCDHVVKIVTRIL